jgi:hypothetical protein
MQTDNSAQAIQDCGQLGVYPTLGFPYGLNGNATSSVQCVLIGLDVRSVDSAQRTEGVSGEQGEHLRLTLTFVPAAEPNVRREPGAKLLRQISPRQTSPQDEINSTHHDSVVLRRLSAYLTSKDRSSESFMRSISLSARRAERAKPNDLN